ncbi:hypothetical protein [Nostoc favosum]|uniref:Uncharacterized protein n=1 Tax=Nostoc favosum CHAB5714 TaxID=2780399 RepID=A0ABS8IJG4_9NOSO|nr:hypothetical protein [Nostoc favosum]MCC5604024.1 hypothetical protein [Nostoc favosum CHAB5714]
MIAFSVKGSKLAVDESKIKIGGLLMIALAMPAAGYAYANRCFCPPETFAGNQHNLVSYFCINWLNIRG